MDHFQLTLLCCESHYSFCFLKQLSWEFIHSYVNSLHFCFLIFLLAFAIYGLIWKVLYLTCGWEHILFLLLWACSKYIIMWYLNVVFFSDEILKITFEPIKMQNIFLIFYTIKSMWEVQKRLTLVSNRTPVSNTTPVHFWILQI